MFVKINIKEIFKPEITGGLLLPMKNYFIFKLLYTFLRPFLQIGHGRKIIFPLIIAVKLKEKMLIFDNSKKKKNRLNYSDFQCGLLKVGVNLERKVIGTYPNISLSS